jgi:hypothetical protein
MQTFLPYPDFELTARCLDKSRLGKQRVEALQIHNIVSGKRTTGGWLNHPAVLMWFGFADALAAYHDAMVTEWQRRGYNNTMPLLSHNGPAAMPPWLGDLRLHISHRANLMRKAPKHYGGWFGDMTVDMPYFWPASGRC